MGFPQEAVTRSKQQTIRQTAAVYLAERTEGAGHPCRFDVVAVLGEEITWIRNAF